MSRSVSHSHVSHGAMVHPSHAGQSVHHHQMVHDDVHHHSTAPAHHTPNPTTQLKQLATAKTHYCYTHDVYRPANAVHIRATQEFSHPYNVLYPVHSVATFEQPIMWRHRGAEKGSNSSSSSSSSSGSLSFSLKESQSFMPSHGGLSRHGSKSHQKKKRGCCSRKQKTHPVVHQTEVHHNEHLVHPRSRTASVAVHSHDKHSRL